MQKTDPDPFVIAARFATYRASGLGKMRAYALTGRDVHETPYMVMAIVKRHVDRR